MAIRVDFSRPAPLIATYLYARFQSAYAIAGYILVCAVLTIIAAVTFTIKGQPPRVLKAGDSIYVPRGTIHRNQNLTDKPARAINLNIMDKDQPQTEQITN
jgi:uncharacterized RmlC-like cupin family protein